MKKILPILRLLRPEQWLKNGFVLAPLFFSGGALNRDALIAALGAFAAFCFLASAVYVFNDIHDLDADREHAKKKTRPLPSGQVSVGLAWALVPVLAGLAGAIAMATGLPVMFYAAGGIYAGVNIAYTLGLKHVALVELVLVASGFVIRLIAGAIAANVVLSPWIILMTGTLALLLVTGKRRADVAQAADPKTKRRALADYSTTFLDQLITMLSAVTLVAYVLYCVSDHGVGRYGNLILLTAVFVVLGVMRYLQIVLVQGGGDSPTTLAVRDPVMAGTFVLWLVTFGALIYGEALLP